MINKELIVNIINDFAQSGKVFVNESQFQFELGFELQKLFKSNDETGHYKVLFEVLYLASNGEIISLEKYNSIPKDIRQKMFTDIVIDTGNEKIAIELKYKIALPSSKSVFEYICDKKSYITFGQGAYDNGCYDYWKDVERLETLKRNCQINRGFAIILTNDQKYWEEHTNSHFKYFFLVKDKTIKGERFWYDKKTNKDNQPMIAEKISISKRYANSIKIRGEYLMDWTDYHLPDNTICKLYSKKDSESETTIQENVYNSYKFKYLILEI